MIYGTPTIVTNGLVLNLDAANTKSYVSGSTNWFSLGNPSLSGSLVNGPTFDRNNGGSIVFDGVNDHAIIGVTPTSLQGNPTFSVEGWFKRNSSWVGGATWGIGGNTFLNGINSYNFPGYDNQVSIDLWGASTYTTGQTYSLTEWKHVVWTYNGGGFTTSNIIIYINTIPYTGVNLITNRGGSGTPNINSTGIVLARAGTLDTNYYSPISIANFKIYSRVLSQQEITQNYNALKSRFGLS